MKITESENNLGWKVPLRSLSPNLALPICHIYTSLNISRDGDVHPLPLGSLFQCLITRPVKKFFLISILNHPCCNLRLLALVLPLLTWKKRWKSLHLSATSFQAVVESDQVSPEPKLLPARLVLQNLHQLRCLSLDVMQHLKEP